MKPQNRIRQYVLAFECRDGKRFADYAIAKEVDITGVEDTSSIDFESTVELIKKFHNLRRDSGFHNALEKHNNELFDYLLNMQHVIKVCVIWDDKLIGETNESK